MLHHSVGYLKTGKGSWLALLSRSQGLDWALRSWLTNPMNTLFLQHTVMMIFNICQDSSWHAAICSQCITSYCFIHTHTVSFFLEHMVKSRTQTNNELTWILSSHWSRAVDSCPTSCLLWSIWWVYLLFIRLGGHQWDTKTRNPWALMRGEVWWSILYLFVFYSLFWWPLGPTISDWLMLFSQYGHITTAGDNPSVYWHLADVPCLLLEECADVCGEGTRSCYPPCCHSVSPQRLLWHMMLINLAEITSSRLSAPSIVRMTSSPSPLSPLFPRERKQSNPQRSSFSCRCSFSPALRFLPHTTTYVCTLESICAFALA